MVLHEDSPRLLPTSAFRPATPSIAVLATMPSSPGAPSLPRSHRAGYGMFGPVQRLLRFVIGLAAVLAAIEISFRVWEPAIAASGNRVLTKAALLDAHGPLEVLFFGTSQSWDDVSPRLFSAQLEQLQPDLRARGFSLAVTS